MHEVVGRPLVFQLARFSPGRSYGGGVAKETMSAEK